MLSDVGRIIRTTSRHASVERRKQASVAAVAVLSQSSRGVGAVVGQLLNGARACVRDGLLAREQEELVSRMEAIEAALEEQKSERRYGA
jgi:hypothetical protein